MRKILPIILIGVLGVSPALSAEGVGDILAREPYAATKTQKTADEVEACIVDLYSKHGRVSSFKRPEGQAIAWTPGGMMAGSSPWLVLLIRDEADARSVEIHAFKHMKKPAGMWKETQARCLA